MAGSPRLKRAEASPEVPDKAPDEANVIAFALYLAKQARSEASETPEPSPDRHLGLVPKASIHDEDLDEVWPLDEPLTTGQILDMVRPADGLPDIKVSPGVVKRDLGFIAMELLDKGDGLTVVSFQADYHLRDNQPTAQL